MQCTVAWSVWSGLLSVGSRCDTDACDVDCSGLDYGHVDVCSRTSLVDVLITWHPGIYPPSTDLLSRPLSNSKPLPTRAGRRMQSTARRIMKHFGQNVLPRTSLSGKAVDSALTLCRVSRERTKHFRTSVAQTNSI